MLTDTITTDRLILPLWSAADVRAIRGHAPLRKPGWHADFPRKDDIDAASMWHEGDPWGPRSITRGVTVLGSIGFFGPPQPVGQRSSGDDSTITARPQVEIGFGLVPEAWGWGFATEAVIALVAAAEAEGVSVHATVEPTNKASLRVLAKAGFTQLVRATEDGHLVMARPISPSSSGSAPA